MFRERLNELRERLPGTRAICLVANDGISVESVGEGVDLEVLAAEFVAMARGVSSEQRGLEIGETDRFEVRTDRYAIMLGRLPAGYYLLLVTDPNALLGKARFELRRASLALEGDLA